MAKIRIGGVEKTGDLDTFAKMDAAWPHIIESQSIQEEINALPAGPSPERMTLIRKSMRNMVAVAAVAVGQTFEQVSSTIRNADEVPLLGNFFNQLLVESRAHQSGEGTGATEGAPVAPSTETSTPSSQS